MKADETNNAEKRMMQYLKKELSEAERHAFESENIDDPFSNDALEGLSNLSPILAEQMNSALKAELSKQLGRKKKKVRSRRMPSQLIFYVALAVVVIIIVISLIMMLKIKN